MQIDRFGPGLVGILKWIGQLLARHSVVGGGEGYCWVSHSWSLAFTHYAWSDLFLVLVSVILVGLLSFECSSCRVSNWWPYIIRCYISVVLLFGYILYWISAVVFKICFILFIDNISRLKGASSNINRYASAWIVPIRDNNNEKILIAAAHIITLLFLWIDFKCCSCQKTYRRWITCQVNGSRAYLAISHTGIKKTLLSHVNWWRNSATNDLCLGCFG